MTRRTGFTERRIDTVSTLATLPLPRHVRLRVHWTERFAHVALLGVALVPVLLAFLAAPPATAGPKAIQDSSEDFVGLHNFIDDARTPAPADSM